MSFVSVIAYTYHQLMTDFSTQILETRSHFFLLWIHPSHARNPPLCAVTRFRTVIVAQIRNSGGYLFSLLHACALCDDVFMLWNCCAPGFDVGPTTTIRVSHKGQSPVTEEVREDHLISVRGAYLRLVVCVRVYACVRVRVCLCVSSHISHHNFAICGPPGGS